MRNKDIELLHEYIVNYLYLCAEHLVLLQAEAYQLMHAAILAQNHTEARRQMDRFEMFDELAGLAMAECVKALEGSPNVLHWYTADFGTTPPTICKN